MARTGVERSRFLSEIIEAVTLRGRKFIDRAGLGSRQATDVPGLIEQAELLLGSRGEASGVARAELLIQSYLAADAQIRTAFLRKVAALFGPDMTRLRRAVDAFEIKAGGAELSELHAAAEPRRQELIRRLNLAPGGTAALVRMREELLARIGEFPELKILDSDFVHLLSSWFNRGFLVLRPIDWSTPANILEKIIRYEAVHEIRGWDDLRRRIEPADRRCFAFFHPALPDEPLVFVEVALMAEIPTAIAPLIASGRATLDPAAATTAVFYSISNCQRGLAGVSFGNFLIKQVVRDLKAMLPRLSTFVTLSPVPGFAAWLAKEARPAGLEALADKDWHAHPEISAQVERPLLRQAATYLLHARSASGRPLDPVARFHLGNGAQLDRMNFLGDLSSKGMAQSHGLMVNYRYVLDEIEENHESFAEQGRICASPQVLAHDQRQIASASRSETQRDVAHERR